MSEKMNFSRVMAAMALRWKDNLAIVNVERNRRYTFAEYHRLTNRIANMCRDRLGLRRGDTAMLLLDNDNFSLVHFPAIFKQEAAFLFGNLRDGPAESTRQLDHVQAKVAFIETRLLDPYHSLLQRRGCTIIAMDRAPDLPPDVLSFWISSRPPRMPTTMSSSIPASTSPCCASPAGPPGPANARCTPRTTSLPVATASTFSPVWASTRQRDISR